MSYLYLREYPTSDIISPKMNKDDNNGRASHGIANLDQIIE